MNWSYPTGTTATANVGTGTVNLTVSGTTSGLVDTAYFPIMYQGNTFTQLSGDSVGAQNYGTTSFQMELTFGGNTAGLILAIGNIAHDSAFSGYQMTAFNAANIPIPINAFGQPATMTTPGRQLMTCLTTTYLWLTMASSMS